MKHFSKLICFFAILYFFNSCKKNDTTKNTDSTSIIGTWELAYAQTGMIPTINYPTGNGNIIEFTNTAYKKYANGNLIKSGNYKMIQDNSVISEVGLVIPAGQFTNRIVLDNDYVSQKTFVQVLNSKLTFLSGFFPTDGGSDITYLKKETPAKPI